MYKYAVCQRDPQSFRWLTAVESRSSKVDTDEITFSVEHVSDGTLCQRLPTSGRQEKYCAALSQIACYAKFALHPGEAGRLATSSGIPRRLYDGIRSRSSKVEISPVRRAAPVANSLYPPEYMFRPLFQPRNRSERVSRTCESRSGSYLACTFKVYAIFEN